MTQSDKPRIVVAGTFTLEPVQEPMEFWLETLHAPYEVWLAPHGQILQQLLDESSAFHANRAGINVLILRPEDCARDLPPGTGSAERRRHTEHTIGEWLDALRFFRSRSAIPLVVLLPTEAAGADVREKFARALQSEVDCLLMQHSNITDLYPVEECLDDAANEIAHVPFTDEYYVAMATLIARQAVRILSTPIKVIVLDCDNTLWGGICGETAPQNLILSGAHREFQQRLVEQHKAGRILCLCSKNNLADVEAVFSARIDMPLRLEHIVAHRINWEPKPDNLAALSAELQLGLDSFVFVDDNPAECEQMRLRHPQVLTLQMPLEADEQQSFLKHTWCFDIGRVTAEAGRRADSYKHNRLREQAKSAAGDFSTFLAGLQLSVSVRLLQPEDLERAAELVVRTNQFNLTTIRRSPAQIAALAASTEIRVLTLRVSDRFGDYGLTGLVILRGGGDVATVDTFLLSCRVLGRGVEAAVLNHLGRWAADQGLRSICLEYRPTPRNAPALQFVTGAFSRFATHTDSGISYLVPVEHAISLTPAEYTTSSNDTASESQADSVTLHASRGTQLSQVPQIIRAIRERRSRRHNLTSDRGGQPPVGAVEQSLALLWQELLNCGPIDRNAGFAGMGGNSVLLVQLASRIARSLDAKPSLAALMRCHSLAAMAELIAALRQTSSVEPNAEVEEGVI
jgi:FkbH-like protein